MRMVGVLAVGFVVTGSLWSIASLDRWFGLRRRPQVRLRDNVSAACGVATGAAASGVGIALRWEEGFGPWTNVLMLLMVVASMAGVLAENDSSDWRALRNRFLPGRR